MAGHCLEPPIPSRAAGLQRLSAFVPRAAAYARERNRVVPPHDRVSRLSPYLRHRLVLESETIAAAWSTHPPAAVEKLVAEVLWRTYWKGWLQLRPQVWQAYLEQWRRDREDLDGAGAERLAAALGARTGIECFDAWIRELTETGYLHNHARMWLASIWIFTLRLPWTLGSAFFLRYLLDGDPASNTLSWRWVAGLHTRGKHYLARAENIARYTDGRFDPRGQLDERFANLGIRLVQVRRAWDSLLWPAATHGFFRFHEHAKARDRLGSLISVETPIQADGGRP